MKWLIWIPGRQGGDYHKKLLALLGIPYLFGFDMYLLKFKPKCHLKEHIDKVERGKHFRLNIILKGKGNFKSEKTIINTRRVVLFRPDKYKHSMLNDDSERKVLSVGLNIQRWKKHTQ
jgi:hypothetical protein